MQTIYNDLFKVSFQEIGAEICSILSLKNKKEYIWQADPEIWGSSAPVLFPIIGCLKEGKFIFEGNSYSIPKHGFIRNNKNLKVSKISDNTVQFSLKYDTESLNYYPFKFEFIIRFILIENRVEVQHEIINHCLEKPMYFSLGGHPAFKCPFNEGEEYEDYYVEFEKLENVNTWEVLSNGLIDSFTKPLLANSNKIALTKSTFDNDALIIKEHNSKKVSLRSKKSSSSITVEYADFSYLGIWAKPGGNFVCLEPWLGISDSHDTNQDFTKKEGVIKLKPNSTFKASYSIIIEEK